MAVAALMAAAPALPLPAGAGPRAETLFSLYPRRGPEAWLAEIDSLPPRRPVAVLACWRPYGLAGCSLSALEWRPRVGPLHLRGAWERQDWSVLRADRLALDLGGELSILRWLLSAGEERIEGGRSAHCLALALARPGSVVLACEQPLWIGGSAGPLREQPARLGLAAGGQAWTLRLFADLAEGAAAAEGIALQVLGRSGAIGLVAGTAPWRALRVDLRAKSLRCRLELRWHDRLGLSQGLELWFG
jgi:hypothetical protein